MNISNRTTYQIIDSKHPLSQRDVWNFLFTIALCMLVSSCASSPRFTKERYSEPKVNASKAASVKSNGKATSYEGKASYYADDFHGKKTANGEIYDMHALTAAHRSFPFGTKVRVTNIGNGKTCVVRVNDRGPFKLERIMDLSLGAAEILEMTKTGTASVKLDVLEWGE